MEHLWARGAADAKAIHGAIGERRRITVNTVQSTLKRLHGKGLLLRDKVSHAYVYAPRHTREEFQRRALDQLLGAVVGREPEAMLAAFVDLTERAGEEHLARLERLVAERRAEASDTPELP